MTGHKQSKTDQILALIEPELAHAGYEVASLEISVGPQKKLQVFIDFLQPPEIRRTGFRRAVSLDDCVRANDIIDPIIDSSDIVNQIFKGNFDLEVSSPGMERPLRKKSDYVDFSGERIRLHLFRALNKDEVRNDSYFESHQKQKNYSGILLGMKDNRVRLGIEPKMEVEIPFELISKANLDPEKGISQT